VKPAYFDARLFVVPENDVVNYFLWRQQDATRNAVQMLGQANFPHKELQGKSNKELQELLFQKKKINFDKEPTGFKRGRCIVRVPTVVPTRAGDITKNVWSIDSEIPIFSQDREYVGSRTKMIDQEETT
jgi:tRNA(His) 5'-end guanylyltransferase